MPKHPVRSQTPAPSGHPISVVAERTGLSRDVLRVWERRYAAVEPMRTPGGQRLYSNEHIERFRLLAAATRHGRNISLVAGLPTSALERLVIEDEAARPVPASDSERDQLASSDTAMTHIHALDGSALDRKLRQTIARRGVTMFLQEVVPTLMRRVGDEWASGHLGIAHEHLASAVVLTLIFEAMRSVPETPGAPGLLVATPARERHAVGAALAAATAALDGWTITYLGVDVPAADVVAAASGSGASAVALSVVHTDDPDHVIAELHAMRSALDRRIPIIVGGAAAVRMAGPLTARGLFVSGSIEEMRRVLARELVSA